MPTNGAKLRALADAYNIPERTEADVQADLAADAARDPEIANAMARLMLKHGRLTMEARKYVEGYSV